MKRNLLKLPLVIVATSLLVGLLGCPQPPPAASVMAGTWQLIPSQSFSVPLTSWFLTYDSSGTLTQIAYTFQGMATVTVNDPPGNTTVNGTALTITVTGSGSGLQFNGTLNSATEPTEATGELSSNINIGGVSITAPAGSATLVKQ